jgi:phytoene dehydrogenase-like protein
MTRPAIVIGGGLSGLTAAALLARRGEKVLLLERLPSIGGTHVTEQLGPGVSCDTVEHDLGWMPEAVLQEIGLDPVKAGLELSPCSAVALQEDSALPLWTDVARTASELRRTSPRDADAWAGFADRIDSLAGFLRVLYERPAPDPLVSGANDLVSLLGLGRHVRSLGREGIFDLLRTLPMSIADVLDETFEGEHLKGLLATSGVMRLLQGPKSGGTAFLFLHHHVGLPKGAVRARWTVRGGVGVVGAALADRARALGVEIRTGAGVARIEVRDDRVSGVTLESGEEIPASLVLSSLDARRTIHGLLDPLVVDPDLSEAVGHVRHRGASAKVNLVVESLPAPGGSTPSLGIEWQRAALIVAPAMSALELAFDTAKHGSVGEHPLLEARLGPPTADGKRQALSVLVQWTPHRLTGAAWDAAHRDGLAELVVAELSRVFPGIAERVVHRQVLTPSDIEERYGASEGSLTHGELMLDQILFMRPVPAAARHTTPIEGLVLCGRATHPALPVASAALAVRAATKPAGRRRGLVAAGR